MTTTKTAYCHSGVCHQPASLSRSGLQAAAHAGGGVQGVLAVAVLDAAAERHLRQVALAQPLVHQRLGAGRTREIERRDGQLEESHIEREPAGHVAGSRCRHQVVDVVVCH
jgi:hypothetical protein